MAPTFTFSLSLGVISAYFLAEILPDPKGDFDAIKENTTWRVIYAYWPMALTVIAMINHIFIVDHDSIKFLIIQEKHSEALYAIRKVYKHAKNEDLAKQYLMKIRNTSGKSSSGLTLKDALFNPQYRKATWVNIGYLIFHELTGINVIILYSSTIF